MENIFPLSVKMFDNKSLSAINGKNVRKIHILLSMIGPWCFLALLNANLSFQYTHRNLVSVTLIRNAVK